MLWSLEFLGSRPSIKASTVSFSKQCDAETGNRLGVVHSCASGPSPMTGKEVIRKRAAPMGIKLTVSTGSADLTGLGWSLPTNPFQSWVQAGTLLAWTFSSRGTVSGLKGCCGSGPGFLESSKDLAGSAESS